MVEHPEEQTEETEYEVIELESDEGEIIHYVVLEHISLDGQQYALLAPVDMMEKLANAQDDDEEVDDELGGALEILRIEKDGFYTLTDDELQSVQDHLDEILGEDGEDE